MEKLNKEASSLFPKPNFALIKNKKLEAEQKKNLIVEKQRVDKAYDQLNAKIDSKSLLKRIKESENQRAKSPDETITKKHFGSKTLKSGDQEIAKTLEEIFNEWFSLLD